MQYEPGCTPWRRIVTLGMVLVLVLAACRGGDPRADELTTTTAREAPVRTPVKGGELVFGVEADVLTLAPGEVTRPSEVMIALGIYDPLMTYVHGKIEPFLAQRIESNDDLTEYSITLRDGVTFHDGTPLNADAVVRHFDRLKDPTTACSCIAAVGQVTSMETPDGPEGLTVVFNLLTQNVTFPDLLAGPSGYIESPTAVARGLDLKIGGVGTGPFVLAKVSQGERFLLEANLSYWGTDDDGTQLPYLDKLTVVPMQGSQARLHALATGAIDILQTSDPKAMREAEGTGAAVQKITASSSPILLFNNAKPPFNDERARRAVALAVDKQVINERAYEGAGVASYSDFDPGSPYYNPAATAPRYDLEQATTLVDELGGLRFTITCPSSPETDLVMPILEELGEAAGMEITLEEVDQAAFSTKVRDQTGQYQAACYRSRDVVQPDAIRPGLTTADGGNLAFYSNDEVDELLDEARRTTDFDERKERYFRVQEILASEVPLLTMVYDVFANVYDDRRVGPPPEGEPGSQGAIKPGLLYASVG